MPSRATRTTDTGIFAIFRHDTGITSCTAVTDTLYGYTNLGQFESVTVVKQDGTAPSQSFSGNRYNATGGAINTTLPTTLYSHDADGSVTKIAYANGTKTDYDYSQMWNDSDGQGVETEKVDVTFSPFDIIAKVQNSPANCTGDLARQSRRLQFRCSKSTGKTYRKASSISFCR